MTESKCFCHQMRIFEYVINMKFTAEIDAVIVALCTSTRDLSGQAHRQLTTTAQFLYKNLC